MVFFKRIINEIKKIPLIDLAFLVISSVLILVFLLFFKRKTELIDVQFKVTDENILYAQTIPGEDYANSFAVDDGEWSNFGIKNATFIKVEKIDARVNKKIILVTIRLKATFDRQKNQYFYKGKPIIYGQPIQFEFSKVKFSGLVINFPGFDQTQEEKQIQVEAQIRESKREFSDVYGVPEYVARNLKINDQIVDNNGKVLAKILEVKTEPAQRMVITAQGEAKLIRDPLLKDVKLLLELTVTPIDERDFIFDTPVLIGTEIPLNFDQLSVMATVTDIISD